MNQLIDRPARACLPLEQPAPARKRGAIKSSGDSTDRVVYYEGKRIYFRPIELADEPRLRQWINNPTNWRTLLFRSPLNACREREWIESLGKNPAEYILGIVVKKNDRLIGTTGLHRVDPVSRSAALGICIGDVDSQGRGFGREAVQLAVRYGFEELNLNRVELDVFADNWRAICTYQQVGFVHEGCLRQAQYRNGRYQDVYRFAILREEWDRCNTGLLD